MTNPERKRLPVSVSAAIFIEDEHGRLLLLQQEAKWKDQKWGPPAGGMEAFESPAETAFREAKEEIGVEVKLVDLVGIYTAKRGSNKTGLAFVFRGKLKSNELNLREGEIKNARFFSPEEIEDLIKNGQLYKPEYNIDCIKDWLEGVRFPLEVIR